MQALEIETTISPQGAIALPPECQWVYGQNVRMILLLDTPKETATKKRRRPPVQFAGKVTETGDVMSSVPTADWGITE